MGMSKRPPITKNPVEAASCSQSAGITAERDPPATAPIKLARTKALDEPRNTANGRSDVPLMATVANWVLSPSSAKNTVTKVEMRRVKSLKISD
jgi:hypothetical protein